MNYIEESDVVAIIKDIFETRAARSQRERGSFEEACKSDPAYISRLRKGVREVMDALSKMGYTLLPEGSFTLKKSVTITRKVPTVSQVPRMRRDTIDIEQRRRVNARGFIGPTRRKGS